MILIVQHEKYCVVKRLNRSFVFHFRSLRLQPNILLFRVRPAGLKQEVPSRPDSMKALDELSSSIKDGTADPNLRNAADVGALCEKGDSAACVALGLMKLEVLDPNNIPAHSISALIHVYLRETGQPRTFKGRRTSSNVLATERMPRGASSWAESTTEWSASTGADCRATQRR